MKVEIRNNSVTLDGYVNVHTRDSRQLPSPRGKFVEQIMPKAFADSLQRRSEVDLLFNHRPDRKLGSTGDNLQLFEDTIGLRAICTVTDDQVVAKAKAGELRGWSFGFIATEQRWAEADNGLQRRFVDSLDLIEVSILDCTPAYVATTIEARGLVTEQRFEEIALEVTVVEDQEERAVEVEVPVPDYTVVETQIMIDKLKGGH
ncbi:HK97 family phage prohead protease [Paenibacillus sp. OV219]|uniref:HK97 family phage prohead protease n=1 Tax=Paenibacillus sp. OV219 TaxID=1884377 RepID=UPI0008AE3359|nr:HK97 family phage prohead protease [Paenibacillus sp. OV219]SEN18982.1 prohead peptidase. Unknown type peptidase. MEROPS family U35 [Paenibacillus sp. OV219]